MTVLEPILVRIVAVIGAAVGAKGTLRYRVSVTHADGSVSEMQPVRTHTVGANEPDNAETVYVRAAGVGSTWGGVLFAGREYQFFIVEERDFGPCEEAS